MCSKQQMNIWLISGPLEHWIHPSLCNAMAHIMIIQAEQRLIWFSIFFRGIHNLKPIKFVPDISTFIPPPSHKLKTSAGSRMTLHLLWTNWWQKNYISWMYITQSTGQISHPASGVIIQLTKPYSRPDYFVIRSTSDQYLVIQPFFCNTLVTVIQSVA